MAPQRKAPAAAVPAVLKKPRGGDRGGAGRKKAIAEAAQKELYAALAQGCGAVHYKRLFDQMSDKTNPQHFYSLLLLALIVISFAVDTSICERGFSTMNMLKTAKRSKMGTILLRLLMTICTLGAEWKDPSKIPVKAIIEEWRDQGARGRYEGVQWQAEALGA